MDEIFIAEAGATARRWSGIDIPNETARQMAADLLKLIADFEALRGGLGFEDEPADFEAALRDCKEPG
ncbi:hypothetical protein CR162_16135 [Pseudoroseomonas rhizosphaerae]|uniref:Uncharacterized protein n=1 Tax=Teichococcus rhizosphaerae TaxID=1335062 RepID=A0A2C7A6H1_9PROT|nr:hypothetical protein [Pseudoroseomonas rhizosphaerae]PHK93950.1 hypothetical protein CR162_16135 [Pseudoroseomonas rhizosphaerae]